MLYVMKVKTKKRVVSRKKQTKPTKAKALSIKKTIQVSKSKKPVKNRPIAGKRNTKYVKGQSGNPKGRPKGSKNKFSVKNMKEALDREALKAGYASTYDYVAERFFADDHVLTAIMKKVLADLKSIENIAISADPVESRKKSFAIQQKLAERMKTKNERL